MLDQAGVFTKPDGTIVHGLIRRFRIDDGVEDLSWLTGFAYGIAFDEATGHLVTTHNSRVVAVWTEDGELVFAGGNGSVLLAAAARGGYACLSQDGDDLLSSLNLNQLPAPLISTAIGDIPFSVAMTQLPNEGPVCSVFNVGDRVFSVVKIPEMQLLRFSTIFDVTSAYDVAAGRGGWQLAVFHSGPRAGIAALLAQADNLLVLMDLPTGQEIRRVNLEADSNPFRIAADEANGKLIVALADAETGTTKFIAVDPLDGSVANLEAVAPFLATGLAVSSDGTKLYAAGKRVSALSFAALDNR